MGREIGVRLWHWAIRKKGTGDDSQDERQPKMATQGKEPTQAATQIVESSGDKGTNMNSSGDLGMTDGNPVEEPETSGEDTNWRSLGGKLRS